MLPRHWTTSAYEVGRVKGGDARVQSNRVSDLGPGPAYQRWQAHPLKEHGGNDGAEMVYL